MASLNKQMKALLKNRPQYEVNDLAEQNQAMAQANAFGRDRAIAGMENAIDQNFADTVGQAQQATSSTGSLLSTLNKLNDSRNATLRGLATDEAALQQQKLNSLYQANDALLNEQDKAWNYNINEPYQNQIQAIRDKKKARQENFWKILDTVGGLGLGLLTGGGSNAAKGLLGGAKKPTANFSGGPSLYGPEA